MKDTMREFVLECGYKSHDDSVLYYRFASHTLDFINPALADLWRLYCKRIHCCVEIDTGNNIYSRKCGYSLKSMSTLNSVQCMFVMDVSSPLRMLVV